MKIAMRPVLSGFPLVSAVMAALIPCASASATLFERAGLWATQPVKSVMVSPDGAKASVDPGPARCAALGHLDSDGVIDLVVAHGSKGRGFAVVTLGDIRFRKGPHHDLEREKLGLEPEHPFLDEATVYQLPFAPDWAAVGDWDSDGDFDVVFAARGLNRLYWMAGDGQAHLSPGGWIELEGGVTAFAPGEVNRRDGLQDLVLAVDGALGPVLLVFEHPEGALSRGPERIGMPTAVGSVAINLFDGDGWRDIAAASGEAVVIVSGRDRRLVSTRAKREAVLSAAITPLDFDAKVLDLASGFFTHRDHQAQLAVRLESGRVRLVRNLERRFEISDLGRIPVEGRMLAARASGLPGHDLLLQPAREGRVEIFHAEASKASEPRLEHVPAPAAPVNGMIAGRLNLDTRDDLVLLGSNGGVEIAASKSRIAIVVDTTDDIDNGGCQYQGCSLREAIISANAQPAGSTITFDLPIGATIEPTSELPALTQTAATSIDGTVGSGFLTGLLTLQGASAGAATDGLEIRGGNTTVIKLIVRGFSDGGISFLFADNNTIEGCRLGLDGTGTDSDPNYFGIRVYGSNDNTIGGTAAGAGNICSGNLATGINIDDWSDTNVILGNRIGLDAAGEDSVSNGSSGIQCVYSLQIQIGSGILGGGNVISGNRGYGINLRGETSEDFGGSLVLGNTVGLNAQRTAAVPNGTMSHTPAIEIWNEKDIQIGGTNAATRNVISGNSGVGIVLREGSPGAQISGNYIGTDGNGTLSIPNKGAVSVESAESLTIGGSVAGAGNVLSGNEGPGITISMSNSVDVLGNLIGLAADGAALGNTESGIYLIDDSTAVIGGSDESASNTIAHNAYFGVRVVDDGSHVEIMSNSIFDNGSLGIDLGNDGVTANDPLDADTGANNLQNFPEIEAVDQSTGDVDFSLNSESSKTYTIRFFGSPSCDASGYGEGKTYLGSMDVTTGSGGSVSDQITLGELTPGAVITATATDPDGNTSEFSQCFSVPNPQGYIFGDGFESGSTLNWSDVVGQ